MKFLSKLTVLAAYVAIALASTVANVETDLTNITSATQSLDNQITAFPNSGGSLTAALAIHTSASNLVTTIQSTTTDVNNVTPQPVSESDAQAILNLVNTLEPVIDKTLTDIVAKKAAFAALPIGGIPALVLQDLQNLNTATQALENALLAQTPSDLKAQANSLISNINAALAAAIAAYS